jgi:crotonobetainyl-CoA:carnitine CoA-transferase CaiB-like acyl-CoA transferase
VIQAVGGLMSITGEPDAAGGHPTKVGVAISDVVTGLNGVIGILAGLLARDGARTRGTRGERGDDPAPASADSTDRHRIGGQRIDVSLLASALATLVNQAQNAFATGHAPGRGGNAHPNIVPYETFETADGELAVAVGSERQWPRFCDALGLGALARDPRFSTNGGRVEHRTVLRPILAARFLDRTSADWLARLTAVDVPCGPVMDILSAFAAPEAVALGMSVEVEHPALGVLRQVGLPLQFERTPGSIRSAPPLLGEHTDEILAELGYDTASIDALRERAVV